jgi:outer membrane protein OmpA-like peptidoglycan-associated protein
MAQKSEGSIKMKKKLSILGSLFFLLLAALPAHSGEGVGEWQHKGWTQWHPHQGSSVLSSMGTQSFFSSADSVPAPLMKMAQPKMEPKVEPKVEMPMAPVMQAAAPTRSVLPPVMRDPSPDLDRDGVLNEQDLCPNTPKGKKVNGQGCWLLGKLFFHFEKSEIQPQFVKELDEMIDYLVSHSDLKVELQGHTDNLGAETLNSDLSTQRAKSVQRYFESKGLSSERMKSVGFGPDRPDTDNSTVIKRYYNRRVEVHPYK